MCSNGKAKERGKVSYFLLSIIFFLYPVLSYSDANQYLPDQLDGKKIEGLKPPKDVGDSPFLPDIVKKVETKKKKKKLAGPKGFLPGDSDNYLDDEKNFKEKLMDSGFKYSGAFDESEEYQAPNDQKFMRKLRGKGKTAISISYLLDNYEYKDAGGVFQKTFDTGNDDSKNAGLLLLSFDRYFKKGDVNWAWGFNLGASYKSGKGIFLTSQVSSETQFILWLIPIDFAIIAEIPAGESFTFSFFGGPSIMGLMQHRSDREQGEAGKRRRQVSWGYIGGAKIKYSLGNLFSRNSFTLLSQMDISDFFLNFESRYQNYGNFQDDITISGVSFGLGLSFEFL